MSRRGFRSDFGFPRWGGYGRDSDAVHLRMCDRNGCAEVGEHPAPKAPGSRDRWFFCESHAAEYNRSWNFFAGMSDEEARRRAESEFDAGAGYRQSSTWGWAGAADADGLTRAERDAFAALDLESDADAGDIKSAFRRLAKQYHPDRNPGDKEAAIRFQRIRTAYEVLRPRLNGE